MLCCSLSPVLAEKAGGGDQGLGSYHNWYSLPIPEVSMSVPQEEGKPGCYRRVVWFRGQLLAFPDFYVMEQGIGAGTQILTETVY